MRSDVEQADDSYGASTWRAYALMLAERLRAAELELVDLRSGAPTRTVVARPPAPPEPPDIDLREPVTDDEAARDLEAEQFGPGPDAQFWSEGGRASGPRSGLRARFGRHAKGEGPASADAEETSAP